MNRFIHNAEYYNEGKGVFEVRYRRYLSRRFPTLLEAFLFYYTIEEAAELWDKTDEAVLIECKIKLSLN